MSRELKNYPNKITNPYKKGTHDGIDIVGSNNGKSVTDYVIAHSDGEIVGLRKTYNKTDKTGNSYGNYVKIKHNNGYFTLYAHLKYNSVCVKVGDKVKKGDTIGYMGNTGHSDGAHLHFEVRDREDERIDPTPYIDSDLPNDWELGTYQLLKSKYIRTSPKVATNNYVLVKQCMESVKPKLTSQKPNDKARYKIGVTINVTAFEYDNKGNLWAKTINTWICACDSSGKQIIKIN